MAVKGRVRRTSVLPLLIALALVVPSTSARAEIYPEPEPVVRGFPPPPNADVVALCPDFSEWPTVFTARDGSGLAGRIARTRKKVVLVDPWKTVAARMDGFDGVVREVYPWLLERLGQMAGDGKVIWIGHGLCGLLPVAATARGSALAPSWVALGTRFDYRLPSPLLEEWLRAWHEEERPLPELLKSLLFSGLRPALGSRLTSVPTALGTDPDDDPAAVLEAYHRDNLARPPPRAVLEDVRRWYATGDMTDSEGWIDYRRGFAEVGGPALIVAGASDAVSPPEAVLPALDALPGAAEVTWHLLSRVDGDREEYGHLGMLLSRHSARDVDPMILAWLAGREELP
jgi:pimeloyl-ACP methyl ester carboxylesterase